MFKVGDRVRVADNQYNRDRNTSAGDRWLVAIGQTAIVIDSHSNLISIQWDRDKDFSGGTYPSRRFELVPDQQIMGAYIGSSERKVENIKSAVDKLYKPLDMIRHRTLNSQYCTCPTSIPTTQTGFETLVFQVCTQCKKERQ